MKSLEIIKRKINEIYGFDDKWEEVEELEQIKQDLERLELLEKTIEIIKKPKNKDGLYTAFYDGVGVNEQEEEILIKVIGNHEDDE